MDIHEYQAKTLLKEYGLSTPSFTVINSMMHLKDFENFSKSIVIKAQVHAGGRKKAGAIKFANNQKEMIDAVASLLGMKMVNHQTGPKGMMVNQVLMTEAVEIQAEFYMSVVIDYRSAQRMLIVSSEGGIDIEDIALKSPEKILKFPITPKGSIRAFHLTRLVNFMGWKGTIADAGKLIASSLVKAFIKTDASMIEINPLVQTTEGNLMALDVKMSFDDNASFRQSEIQMLYDPSQSSAEEVEAKIYNLAYVALDGNIGCIVNGAGLAMATMDLIHLSGGKAANFLDVGGGASPEQIEAALKIILSEPKVKGILINIFGGIMNCETLATGLKKAALNLKVTIPIVIRMEGTNVEKGKEILIQSGLKMTIANTLIQAVDMIVANVREA